MNNLLIIALIFTSFNVTASEIDAIALSKDDDWFTGVWKVRVDDDMGAYENVYLISKNDSGYKLLYNNHYLGEDTKISKVAFNENRISFEESWLENGYAKTYFFKGVLSDDKKTIVFENKNSDQKSYAWKLLDGNMTEYDFYENDFSRYSDGSVGFNNRLKLVERLSKIPREVIEQSKLWPESLYSIEVVDKKIKNEIQYYLIHIEDGVPRGRGTCGGQLADVYISMSFNKLFKLLKEKSVWGNICAPTGDGIISQTKDTILFGPITEAYLTGEDQSEKATYIYSFNYPEFGIMSCDDSLPKNMSCDKFPVTLKRVTSIKPFFVGANRVPTAWMQ